MIIQCMKKKQTHLLLKEGGKITWEAYLENYDESQIQYILDQIDEACGTVDEENAPCQHDSIDPESNMCRECGVIF